MLPYPLKSPAVAYEWEYAGLPCAIVRQPAGHLCGYVGVPVEHLAHGFADHVLDVDFEDIPRWPYRRWHIQTQVNRLPALTYSGGNLENTYWWFGFDFLGRPCEFRAALHNAEALAAALRRIK